MAVAKRQQGSPIFLTLVIFIALFVIATVFSIVFYVKYEEQTTNLETRTAELNRWVNSEEVESLNSLIGPTQAGESVVRMLVNDINDLVTAISGKQPDIAAQIKFDTAIRDINSYALPVFKRYIVSDTNDPNSFSLVRVVSKLGQKLDTTVQSQADLQKRYDLAFNEFGVAKKSFDDTVAELNKKLEAYTAQVNDIRDSYNKLKADVQQNATETEKGLTAKVKAAEDAQSKLKDELLQTQATLMSTSERMNKALSELTKIKPLPDSNALAYQADGQVILYDPQTKIVHINLGSDDGVYRGLTFGVYDKDLPFPKDGKGKAEIEVYDVDKTISSARLITAANPRNPIIKGDIIANLVWDKNQKYYFVVAGEFAQAGNADKVKALIEKMGGNIEESVSVNTDFVVLGNAPDVLLKPTPEQIELNPTAQSRYEASLKAYEHYKQIEQDAKTFSIPIFNFDRFLYFTGYKEQVSKPGAF